MLFQAEAHAFERRRLVELPRVRHLDGPRLHRINQIALVLSIDIAARGELRVRLLVVEMGSVARGFSTAADGEGPGSLPQPHGSGAEQQCQRERSSQPHGCVRNSESFGLPPNQMHHILPQRPSSSFMQLVGAGTPLRQSCRLRS